MTAFAGATRQWAYVALSRVRSLDTLFLAEELTDEQRERFNRPMPEFEAHEQWLNRLEERSLAPLREAGSDPMPADT